MEAISIIAGTYAITYVITDSSGAWGVLERVRVNQYISRFGLFECFLCTSFWVALVLSRFDFTMLLLAWGVSFLAHQLVIAYMEKS